MTLVQHHTTDWGGVLEQPGLASQQETSALASLGWLLNRAESATPPPGKPSQATSPSFHPASPPGSGPKKWFHLVAHLHSLQPPTAAAGHAERRQYREAVVALIREAGQAASRDSAWRDSGIAEHLARAASSAKQEGATAAREAAFGLLDFHRIVLRSNTPRRKETDGAGTGDNGDIAAAAAKDASTAGAAPQRVVVLSGNRLSINTQGSRGHTMKVASWGTHSEPSQEAVKVELDRTFSTPSMPGSPPLQPSQTPNQNPRPTPDQPSQPRSPPLQAGDQRPLKKRRFAQNAQQNGSSQQAQNLDSVDSASPAGFSGDAARIVHELWSREKQALTAETPTSSDAAAHMLNNRSSGHNDSADFHGLDSEIPSSPRLHSLGGRASRTKHWSGKVKHKLGESTVELFYMTALIPETSIDHFPPSLFVSALVQRNTIKLSSKHQPLRCRLDFMTTKQIDKLKMLASLGLAAVCSLQHCSLTLVPYLGEGKQLRIMGFLLADT